MKSIKQLKTSWSCLSKGQRSRVLLVPVLMIVGGSLTGWQIFIGVTLLIGADNISKSLNEEL